MDNLARLRKVDTGLTIGEQLDQSKIESLDLDFQEIVALHEQVIQTGEYEQAHQTYEAIKLELENKKKRQKIQAIQEETNQIKQETVKKKSLAEKLKKYL